MPGSGQVEAPLRSREVGGAVVLGDFPMPALTRFGLHRHDRHQVVWARAGIVVVDTDEGQWVLPPSRALWIPSGLAHETSSVSAAEMRSLYLDPARCRIRWPRPTPVAASALLAALTDRLARTDLDQHQRRRSELVVVDLLEPVPFRAIDVPLPEDPRAREVADRLVADPADQRSLAAWGREVGASGRTLARAFSAETGLSFGRWRTLARARAAVGLLAEGRTVTEVASRVGYDNVSAFVAAFRRCTGSTPGTYAERPG